MIYAMSDIHGCADKLIAKMSQVDFGGDNRVIFLGDYIDYGRCSFQVLKYIYELQKQYGGEKVVVLKGNHEQMFLEWIDDFKNPCPSGPEELLTFNDWLRTDFEYNANTIRTFVSEEQMSFLERMSRTSSLETTSREAVKLILLNHKRIVRWLSGLPCFYETDRQIFVHAGVDEEAGEYWKVGSSEDVFLWKFPPSKGRFYKTIIAGHAGTGARELANDFEYHDVYYDGASHYYIDGSAYKKGGKLLLLAFEEESGIYYSIEDDGRRRRV